VPSRGPEATHRRHIWKHSGINSRTGTQGINQRQHLNHRRQPPIRRAGQDEVFTVRLRSRPRGSVRSENSFPDKSCNQIRHGLGVDDICRSRWTLDGRDALTPLSVEETHGRLAILAARSALIPAGSAISLIGRCLRACVSAQHRAGRATTRPSNAACALLTHDSASTAVSPVGLLVDTRTAASGLPNRACAVADAPSVSTHREDTSTSTRPPVIAPDIRLTVLNAGGDGQQRQRQRRGSSPSHQKEPHGVNRMREHPPAVTVADPDHVPLEQLAEYDQVPGARVKVADADAPQAGAES